ncbi:Peptidase family M48 [Burkholderiales bacterium JOSHI_001]|nr:Peptidase family M48 [Burkholderiales bacterium JOSHI_001]
MNPCLAVHWFDGVRPKARDALIRVDDGDLVIEGQGADAGLVRRVPLKQVRWPERQRHGVRLAHLAGGGTLSGDDGAAWDAWARASGLDESPVVALQQSWRAVGLVLLATLALLGTLWLWGVPAAAHGVMALLPTTLDQRVGDAAFEQLDKQYFKPSALPPAQQQGIRDALAQAVQAAYPAGARPAYTLYFRTDAQTQGGIGANALALPGGHVVLTDAMAQLFKDQPQVLVGVLAHELGHVRHRHGMRMLVQTGLLGALAGLVVGDFSSLLAGIPALLGQQAYSRDFEREADAEALRVLKANRIAPRVMLALFERMEAQSAKAGGDKATSALPIALASHPSNEERRRFFGGE